MPRSQRMRTVLLFVAGVSAVWFSRQNLSSLSAYKDHQHHLTFSGRDQAVGEALISNLSESKQRVEIEEPSTKVDLKYAANCTTSFYEKALQIARRYSPPGSPAYEKNRRVLSFLTHFHHSGSTSSLVSKGEKRYSLFSDVDRNIIRALKSLGLKQTYSREDINESGRKNTTALVYYSIEFAKTCRMAAGKICKDMHETPRIIVQTEQIPYSGGPIQRHLQDCHELPSCVIWDWSEHHWQYLRTESETSSQAAPIHNSTILLPTMFQTRFSSLYTDMVQSMSLKQRTIVERPTDVSFFGKTTNRREALKENIVSEYEKFFLLNASNPGLTSNEGRKGWDLNHTTSPEPLARPTLSMQYGKLQQSSALVQAYAKSKVCLVVHAFHPSNVAGEFHRLGDIQQSGCQVIMESLPNEPTWTHALEVCGGVIFGDYEELPRLIVQQLMTNFTEREKFPKATDLWWEEGVQWGSLLIELLDLSPDESDPKR